MSLLEGGHLPRMVSSDLCFLIEDPLATRRLATRREILGSAFDIVKITKLHYGLAFD